MPEITIQGHRIHYREQGSGRAVVLIHGLAGASGFWRETFLSLSGYGRAIAPDLLGFGDSDKPVIAYSLEGHAEMILGISDALGVREFDLIGHSMGGMIALIAALRSPDRIGKLILINTPVSGRRALHGRGRIGATPLGIALVKIALSIPWILRALRRIKRYYFVLDPLFTEDAGKAPYSVLKSHAEAVLGTDLTPRLQEVSVPVLIMGTQEDGIVRPSEFSLTASKILGARQVWIKDAGHCPTLERPVESHEAMIRFLKGNPGILDPFLTNRWEEN
ncbi:MAG: hypothetical protein AUK29_05250 [Nitrospirae bacterium CG2_30_53_67]|nr:MAG: hypothetical protein AUK29_05250 [Nitrospirae bacterium CG2_30_53_67]